MSDAPTPSRPETLRELSYLFTFLRPYRRQFIAALIASMVSMSFGTMFPYLVGRLVDAAVPSVKVLADTAWKPAINTVAGLLLGTLIIQSVLTFFSSFSFQKTGERAVADLRHRLFSRVLALPMRFFGERRVGELSSRLSNDLAQIQDLFGFVVPQAVRQVMLILCGAVAITVTSWKLSLVMVASLPPVVLVTIWFGRSVRRHSREAQDRLAEGATIVEESLQNIASVKAYTNEGYEERRYGSALERFIQVIIPTARQRAALIGFVITGIFGSITLVLWYGAHLMQEGQLSHGELTRFTLFTILIGGSVAATADVIASVNKTLGASQRVRELFREEPEDLTSRSATPVRLAGDVRFEDVRFRYPSRSDVEVLRGLSLHAAPGEKIALVGPSGAGKSTIVSMLLRFYDPDAGRLLLDGKPATDLELGTVRGNMAIVPQEVMLFGGSIRDNIAYGKPNASEEEIRTAARRANCHEFIEKFPEGYDTRVGERGVKLSGGQRQRIAIARALLKDPAILILDEATSSLDSESERLIQEALDTLLEGRTAFIIAHRLATVRQVDRIYVIEEGRATESGTHEELIEREGGTYRRLSELQFSV
ncbi:ABC transporter ATP-binding protein [Verrucomicrobiota bacterium sgz303538]